MTIFVVVMCLLLVLAIPIGGLYLLWRWLRARWLAADEAHGGKRVAILCAGALIVSSPYLLFKGYELHFVLARVPEPLRVSWIEYRLEESWGIGLPGDNETGFVVYRMTSSSAEWARRQGQNLGVALQSGPASWYPTPVDQSEPDNRWHRRGHGPAPNPKPTIREYLDQYGFSIPLEKGQDAEADDAIQRTGSFYSYGPGGSITIVDPSRGKVYFAYAG